MQPDNDTATTKPKVDTLAKLALICGLAPRDMADFLLFLSKNKYIIEDKSSSCLSDLMFPLDKIE